MQEYRHDNFKDVFFANDPLLLPTGCFPTGNSADRYSEEDRIYQMASILGYAQCLEHHLHARGTVSFPAQWFLHDSELRSPTPIYWS